MALLSVYGQLMRLGDLGTWWHGFFSFLASGPPGPRLRALRGLAEAGLVRFLGADMTVRAVDGAFEARSAGLPEHAVRARALVEARLPQPEAGRVRDPLLRGLFAAGAAATGDGLLAVTPQDGRVRWSDGSTHPRLFALGPHTDARGAGAFTRPRTNSPAFRQNDATARALLAGVAGLRVSGAGVARAVQIGCDLEASRWTVRAVERWPQLLGGVAIHPNEAPLLAARGELGVSQSEPEELGAVDDPDEGGEVGEHEVASVSSAPGIANVRGGRRGRGGRR